MKVFKFVFIVVVIAMSSAAYALDVVPNASSHSVSKYQVLVRGRESVTVTSHEIRLGDVAEINVQDPSGDEAAAALHRIVLAYAPSIGGTSTLSAAEILAKLKGAGVDLTKIGYVLPRIISISSAGRVPQQQEIRPVIEDFLKQVSPAAKLMGIHIPDGVQISPATTGYEVIPDPSAPYDSRRIKLITRGEKAPSSEFEVSIRVEDWREVPVARHGIQKGAIISEGDMMMARLNLAGLPQDATQNSKEVVGQQSLQAVGPGQVFRKSSLSTPPVIESGDKVTLMARSRFLQASVTAVALESGAPGDKIRVRSDLSKKVLSGKIIEAGLVEVGQ